MNYTGPILAGVAGVGGFILLLSSSYIVDEGRVAVITHMGKASHQEKPAGLQFKAPFITGVREFDVRERALTGELNGATSNQLPTSISFSVNWRPDPDQVMAIFIDYGGPDEFAANTIRPRLQQSLKSTIGKFTGEDLIRKREEVAAAMLEDTRRVLQTYPAIITSVQLENFTLPERYMEAALQVEEQRETTKRERLKLEQQALQAQQSVQTAKAEAEAARQRADGEAYAITTTAKADSEATRLRAEAEADGISAIEAALAQNPLLVEYERAKRWDGQMPTTLLGNSPDVLMPLPRSQ